MATEGQTQRQSRKCQEKYQISHGVWVKPKPFQPQQSWAFNHDAAQHKSFTKLIRYCEGLLQREFFRAPLGSVHVQDKRRGPPAPTAPPFEPCGKLASSFLQV
jgi:hypothetical protein